MTPTQETRKASNRQPQLTPKTTDKEEQQQQNSQNQYMERNHKDMNRNKLKINERNNSKD